MKRQLLMAAMAAMTLGASAQMTEVARDVDISFLPKSLTTSGEVIPYAVESGVRDNDLKVRVYTQSFDEVKTIQYAGKEFSRIETPMKATVDIIDRILYSKGGYPRLVSSSVDIKSFDEFKEYVRAEKPDISDIAFFITDDGKWAYSTLEYTSNTVLIDDEYLPTVIGSYTYYDNEQKAIYNEGNSKFVVKVDLDNVVWEKDADKSSTVNTFKESLYGTYVTNYDNADGLGHSHTITQNLFNNDSKYEFIVRSYKETSAPVGINTKFGMYGLTGELSIGGLVGERLKITKKECDKYFSEILKVQNEDGDVLFSSEAYHNMLMGSVYIYILNGKKYMKLPVSDDGKHYTYVLYQLTDSGTGVQEVARTKPVKVEKYYNAAGVQVDKDAKGIVITDGGKKYINQ